MATARTVEFLAADSDFDSADIVVLGVPFDRTSSFRRGAAEGPAAIRAASDVLETYSPVLERDLEDCRLHDLGDVRMPSAYTPGATVGAIESVIKAVTRIIHSSKIPAAIGGNHSITVPIVREIASRREDMAVLYFDAHLDLRPEYEGRTDSHASTARRLLDFLEPANLFIVGGRSGTRTEFEEAQNLGLLHPFAPDGIDRIVRDVGSRPVYITFDVDVFDPSVAPGITTPEPGGASFNSFVAVLPALACLNIAGFDVVEVCPPADPGGVTAVVAAKVVRELICAAITL